MPYIESDPLHAAFNRKLGPLENYRLVEPLTWFCCPNINDGKSVLAYYSACTGVGADSPALPVTHLRAGAFAYDRGTKVAEFQDGMTNTILLFEVRNPIGNWATGGPATARPADAGDLFPGQHSNDAVPFRRVNTLANIAMADGSVRTLRSSVAPEVLNALATLNGGEPAEGLEP